MWAFIHLTFLTGFKNRFVAAIRWVLSFVGRARTERALGWDRTRATFASPRRGHRLRTTPERPGSSRADIVHHRCQRRSSCCQYASPKRRAGGASSGSGTRSWRLRATARPGKTITDRTPAPTSAAAFSGSM